MPGKLLSLYLRAGMGAARLAFNLTARVVKVAGDAVGFGAASARDTAPPTAERAEEPTPREREATPREQEATPRQTEPRPAGRRDGPQEGAEPGTTPLTEAETFAIDYDAAPVTPLEPAEERAKSIDDQPELVEELAEPGAEDGAGAEIEVEEPWDGYHKLNADEVIARVADLGSAELAVLELYEGTHKQRRTVLGAAERRHKAISGRGAR